jgi:hypothetical protein
LKKNLLWREPQLQVEKRLMQVRILVLNKVHFVDTPETCPSTKQRTEKH